MQKSAAYQLLNKVALVASTRLIQFQASAATYLSADLLRPQIELPGKLGRASAIYLNKISMSLKQFFAILFIIWAVIFLEYWPQKYLSH
jgi:hypothetical protein